MYKRGGATIYEKAEDKSSFRFFVNKILSPPFAAYQT